MAEEHECRNVEAGRLCLWRARVIGQGEYFLPNRVALVFFGEEALLGYPLCQGLPAQPPAKQLEVAEQRGPVDGRPDAAAAGQGAEHRPSGQASFLDAWLWTHTVTMT